MVEDNVQKSEFEMLESRLNDDINYCREILSENSEAIVRLETLYETLAKLPDTIEALRGTVVDVNSNLERMCFKIEKMQDTIAEHRETLTDLQDKNKEINNHVNKIDAKSKIDWQSAVTKNFWSILAVLGVLYLVVKNFWETGRF